MDTSKEYIKMCEKAEEVQEEKRAYGLIHGDYFWQSLYKRYDDSPETIGLIYDENRVSRYGMMTEIWLPRQDQLQILSGLGWYLFDKTCVTWATTNPDYQGKSKEIMGLCVAMKEKHNKVWNGEDWRT